MAKATATAATTAALDRRQRKTRRAIYAAFEDLMTREHYSEVTVAQIIETADIGRSTFYAHFETKDELLNCICTEMFDHIFEGVNQFCTTHSELETADLAGKLAHLLYHLRDTHSGVCGKLIQEGEPIFARNFRQRLTVLIKSETTNALPKIPADLKCEMLVSAFCQAVTWWFNDGARLAPETVAAYYIQIIPAS
jgi:AcrR family transcriptional regulator